MRRTWNLASVLQIVQGISEKNCHCLYLSIDHVWWVSQMRLKRYIQKCTALSTNTHHGIKDFVKNRMVKNTKTWMNISRENITFLWSKKIINLCLRRYILRSYSFVAHVTFKQKCTPFFPPQTHNLNVSKVLRYLFNK